MRSSSTAPQFGQVRDGSRSERRVVAASGSSAERSGSSSIRTIVLLRGSGRRRQRHRRRRVESDHHSGGSSEGFDRRRVGRRRGRRGRRLLGGVMSLVGRASAPGCAQDEGGEERRSGSISTHDDLRIAAHSTGKRQILSVSRGKRCPQLADERGPLARTLGNPRFSRAVRLVRPLKRRNGKKGVGMGVPALTERGESADSPLLFLAGLSRPFVSRRSRPARARRGCRAPCGRGSRA